ncbi:MAG: DUF697 domain-containing protein [Saprospiraceae bacterium]|nr:DUF697 domain-containing protein [Candidatus Brachybacter algidus]
MENNEEQVIAKQADAIIRNSVIFASGAGLIPIPIADFMAVTAVQLEMIRRLSKLYEVDFRETEGKAAILALTSSGLARLSGRMLAKMIPVIGTIVGGVAVSALSGASTYAVGEVFKRHFNKGGTFLDFDWASFKNFYNEKFEKGKAYTEKIKKENKESAPLVNKIETTDDYLDSLQRLFEMKASGAINDDDYERLKSEVMKNVGV